MKRVCLRVLPCVFACTLALTVSATAARDVSFHENFDSLANWLFKTNPRGSLGNWRLENGVLAHDAPGDGFVALVDDVQAVNQVVQTDVRLNGPAGYGGIAVWYVDPANWTAVFLYPAAEGVWVLDTVDGITDETRYAYPLDESRWYRLAVATDGHGNRLTVSVDGSELFRHALGGRKRSGRSGLYSGNSGGQFDNFDLQIRHPRHK